MGVSWVKKLPNSILQRWQLAFGAAIMLLTP